MKHKKNEKNEKKEINSNRQGVDKAPGEELEKRDRLNRSRISDRVDLRSIGDRRSSIDPKSTRSEIRNRVLPVVADPHRELRLAEFLAAARQVVFDVFPVPVQESAPRPVEVEREPERHRREADAV